MVERGGFPRIRGRIVRRFVNFLMGLGNSRLGNLEWIVVVKLFHAFWAGRSFFGRSKLDINLRERERWFLGEEC